MFKCEDVVEVIGGFLKGRTGVIAGKVGDKQWIVDFADEISETYAFPCIVLDAEYLKLSEDEIA